MRAATRSYGPTIGGGPTDRAATPAAGDCGPAGCCDARRRALSHYELPDSSRHWRTTTAWFKRRIGGRECGFANGLLRNGLVENRFLAFRPDAAEHPGGALPQIHMTADVCQQPAGRGDGPPKVKLRRRPDAASERAHLLIGHVFQVKDSADLHGVWPEATVEVADMQHHLLHIGSGDNPFR